MKRFGVLSITVLLLGACSSSDAQVGLEGTNQIWDPDSSYTAQVDADAGTISLPYESYFLSDAERRVIEDAGLVLVSECMLKQGVDEPAKSVIANADEDFRYGRWNLENAAQFGYSPVTTPALLEAHKRNSEAAGTQAAESEELDRMRNDCWETAASGSFDWYSVQNQVNLNEERQTAWDLAMAAEPTKALFGEWEQCLTEVGLKRDPTVSPFAIAGANYEGVEEQDLQLAIKDVTCKNHINFTKRIADIEASYQGPFVKKHEAELTQMRAELDAMLMEARDILASESGS